MPIIVSIDLRKIDQSKCKSHANGAKYCDIILLDRTDNYGNDFMVVQGVSKEERAAGVKGAILGNGKHTGGGGQSQQRPPAPAARPRHQDPDLDEESIPF